jgi:hypothetical protein
MEGALLFRSLSPIFLVISIFCAVIVDVAIIPKGNLSLSFCFLLLLLLASKKHSHLNLTLFQRSNSSQISATKLH